MAERWTLYLDETGSIGPGSRELVVGGLLLRERDDDRLVQAHRAIRTAFPWMPFPFHATEARRPVQHLVWINRGSTGVRALPQELREPARALIRELGPPVDDGPSEPAPLTYDRARRLESVLRQAQPENWRIFSDEMESRFEVALRGVTEVTRHARSGGGAYVLWSGFPNRAEAILVPGGAVGSPLAPPRWLTVAVPLIVRALDLVTTLGGGALRVLPLHAREPVALATPGRAPVVGLRSANGGNLLREAVESALGSPVMRVRESSTAPVRLAFDAAVGFATDGEIGHVWIDWLANIAGLAVPHDVTLRRLDDELLFTTGCGALVPGPGGVPVATVASSGRFFAWLEQHRGTQGGSPPELTGDRTWCREQAVTWSGILPAWGVR